MEKELKDYLHLYFKCWGEVSKSNSEEYSNGKWALSAKILHEAMMGNLKFKPILRPLSDMNLEEQIELRSIKSETSGGLWFKNADMIISNTDPFAIKYLLSKGFDLFGLIDAGLAIDKTKLNEKV